MRIGKTAPALVALAMLLGACGGGTEPSAGPASTSPSTDTTVGPDQPAVETAVPTTTTPDDDAAPATATRPAPDPNREIAPDFTLALSDGSTFMLSEETRPVFMVFWAEW